jgi:hypothetical protein
MGAPTATTFEDRVRAEEEAGWARDRAAWEGSDQLAVDDEDAVVTQALFAQLLEYSLSLPSGTYVGKLWKARQTVRAPGGALVEQWFLVEYVSDPDPKQIGIRWRRLHVVGA